jgi:hypothetical protein
VKANIFFIENVRSDKAYKEVLLDTLCTGVTLSSSLRDLLEYVIDHKLQLFDRYEFMGSLYTGDDDTIDLILPSIKRVWGKIYVDYPTIFSSKLNRLELFQQMFNIDEFIDYLIDKFIKSKGLLLEFESLDRTSETLTLIVNNYIGTLVKRTLDSKDIKKDIRDFKINKII